MQTLTVKDIFTMPAAALQRGDIIPDGIVEMVDVTDHGTYVTLTCGDTVISEPDRMIDVIGHIDAMTWGTR